MPTKKEIATALGKAESGSAEPTREQIGAAFDQLDANLDKVIEETNITGVTEPPLLSELPDERNWLEKLMGVGQEGFGTKAEEILQPIQTQAQEDIKQGGLKGLLSSMGAAEIAQTQAQAAGWGGLGQELLEADERVVRSGIQGISYLQGTIVGKAPRVVLRPLSKSVRKEATEKVTWKGFKDSIAIGWLGKPEYVGAPNVFNRIFVSNEEREAVGRFFDRHPTLSKINNVGLFLDELTAHILADVFVYQKGKAIIKGALKTAKGKAVVKNILDKIPKSKLGSYSDMVEEAAEQMKLAGKAEIVMKGLPDHPITPDELELIAQQLDMKIRIDRRFGQATVKDGVIRYALGMEDDVVRIMKSQMSESTDIAPVIAASLKREYLHKITTKVGDADALLPKKNLDDAIRLHTFGKGKTIDDLNPLQLDAVVQDVGLAISPPQGFSTMTDVGMTFGGMPTWRVFENLKYVDPETGLVRNCVFLYDNVDEGLTDIMLYIANRENWKDGIKKVWANKYGKWTDDVNKTIAEIADAGPRSDVMARLSDKYTTEQVTDILDIVTEDKKFWDELWILAKERGLTEGLTKEEWYFHHRKKFYDAIVDRSKKQAVKTGTPILPADMAISKHIDQSIPSEIKAAEFMVRSGKPENFNMDWDYISSMAYREELRKIFLEPPLKRLDQAKNNILAHNTEYGQDIAEYFSDWAKTVRQRPTRFDSKLNRFTGRQLEKLPLVHIKTRGRPFERFSRFWRKMVLTGTMSFNPRTWAKQASQSLLTVNTIGRKATAAGIESVYTEGGRRLLGKYRVMINRMPLSEFNIAITEDWVKLSMAGHAGLDKYLNCAGAGNGAMYKMIFGNKKYLDELVDFGARQMVTSKAVKRANFWNVLADYVDVGGFPDLMYYANRDIKYTQWSYHWWDMPKHLWGQAGKTAFQFSSWPSNYAFAHIPQLIDQLTTGTTVLGLPATKWERAAIFRHILRGAAVAGAGYKLGINMNHVFISGPVQQMPLQIRGQQIPVPGSPAIDLLVNSPEMMKRWSAVGWATFRGDGDEVADNLKALSKLHRSHIPLGSAAMHWTRPLRGEPPLSIFFAPHKEKKKPEATGFGGAFKGF